MSNGSENIPEHISEICKALVKVARVWADEVERVEAERDALRSELDQMKADLHEWETVGAPQAARAKHERERELLLERDALRAQLAEYEGPECCEARCQHDAGCSLETRHEGGHEFRDDLYGDVLCSWE